MRPVQYFSDEYLERTKEMTTEQILEFLESFRRMHEKPASHSIEISNDIFIKFREACIAEKVNPQTKVEAWIRDWLEER